MTPWSRRAVALVLVVLGGALAASLLLEYHGEGLSVAQAVCGPDLGCETVSHSPYARVFGLPLAAVGLFSYGSLAMLLLLSLFSDDETSGEATSLVSAILCLALAVDLVLLGLQAFRIHAFCRLCLATYAVNLAVLAALPPFWRMRLDPSRWLRIPGRIALTGWVFGSLAAGAAVLLADDSLAQREAARGTRVLGTPPKEANPEAQRLQAILDDPAKLEQYLNEKASRDFDNAVVQSIDLESVPFRGSKEAAIKVVDYSDFLCPYCRQAAKGFEQVIPRMAGKVKLYYKHYPLDATCNGKIKQTVHPGACVLAIGGLCADAAGKFWAYHDAVFSTEFKSQPLPEDAARIAVSAGIPEAPFRSCLDSPGTRSKLEAQIEEAARIGVQATPTVFVNGRKLPRVDHFFEAVEKESRRLGIEPPPSPGS